jgi:thymidylate kinase
VSKPLSRREGSGSSPPRDRRGRLYVVEGIDGVGKTTVVDALVKKLSEQGIRCLPLASPGKTPLSLGAWVHELHHSPEKLTSLSPSSLQLLHVAAHIDMLESKLLPALRSGTSVVLDRFWWSTWVYGLAGGVPERALRRMLQVEHSFWGKVRPAAVFLLSRNIPSSSDDASSQRLERLYLQLCSQESRRHPIHRVTNDGAVQTTLARIIAYCDNRAPASSAMVLRAGGVRPPVIADTEAGPDERFPQQPELFSTSERGTPVPRAFTSCGLTITSKLSRPKPTLVFDTYWRFAAARQAVFYARLEGGSPPWTNDRILLHNKFTNAYRASDRVSQYLIQRVIYSGSDAPEEVFLRTILFKLFNKIETWERLVRELDEVAYCSFDIERYDRALTAAKRDGISIYSGAYIMPTGGARHEGGAKHTMHLSLVGRMMREELPRRIYDARSMREVFELLRGYPTIGDFLAYQYATDLNYSRSMHHSEMDFVVPGPGARDGIRKCFSDLGGLTEADLIRYVADQQESEFQRLGVQFRDLWGRPLQLIDCQNLFCEVDKYARAKHPEVSGVSGRTRIKQRFRPRADVLKVWYPPKWGINERIPTTVRGRPSEGPLRQTDVL